MDQMRVWMYLVTQWLSDSLDYGTVACQAPHPMGILPDIGVGCPFLLQEVTVGKAFFKYRVFVVNQL